MTGIVERLISDSVAAIAAMRSPEAMGALVRAVGVVSIALRSGRFVYLVGNGGSAADAQHIAAELAGRFLFDRRSLPAISLTTNASALTAIANDHGYETVFARQLEGVLRRGDVLFAISTSGNSPNILAAVRTAHKKGAAVIAMTGRRGGRMRRLLGKGDVLIAAPTDATPRIQECHALAGHIICELVEKSVCGK
ncbi:MAG: SIS domain-containing protein [Planctomycetota bacterium]|nr:SIS domain-containing protein [Planctomycetota bacterium]